MLVLKKVMFINMLLVALVLFDSCKKSIKSKSELIAYVNEPKNGLQMSQQAGKVETSLTNKPWQLMALNQQKGKSVNSTQVLNDLKNKYFFVLSLSANHKELLRQIKFSDYSQMVQVMAFRMMEYVSAVPDNGKAVAPEDCLFQQTYGMGTANQLLIVFDKLKFEKAKQIEIKIKEFGLNIGNLNYRFSIKDINDLQNIALNN